MRVSALLSSRFLLLLLSISLICPSLRAEEVPGSPGWTLTKMEKREDDNSYDTKTYYGLKPPDQRGSITVDSRTASRLQAGEMSAESAYSGGGGAGGQKAAAAKEEEFVYGKNNGIVMAEPVNSTLTVEEGRKETPLPAATPRAVASSSSGSSGSLSGSSSLPPLPTASLGGNQNSAPKALAAALPAANKTGASSMPGAGGGAPPIVNPALAVIADAQAQHAADLKAALPSTKTDAPPRPSAITLNQVGQGFGMSPDGKTTGTKTAISVWPNGDPDKAPGTDGGPPKCPASMFKDYFQPSVIRLQVPLGCNHITIRAWGAGGGDGDVADDGSGQGAKGGGGTYVYSAATVDPAKFDFVIVVGGPGANGRHFSGGAGGAPGNGGKGGDSGFGPGGGGGGFSGVFYVERSKVGPDDKPTDLERALVVAAGGGGGGGTALAASSDGGPGGADKGGGLSGGGTSEGGKAVGNGKDGGALYGGEGGNGTAGGPQGFAAGGGGGGGFFGGAGGNGSGNAEALAAGGGGGSSFSRFLDDFKVMPGNVHQGGNTNYIPRQKSGDNGYPGRVILEFF